MVSVGHGQQGTAGSGALDPRPRSLIESRRNRRDRSSTTKVFRGREDVSSQVQFGLAAWATGVHRRGVLALGPDLPEQDRESRPPRRRPGSGARDRRHLVLLLSAVHRRRLPPRAAGPLQPQAPRRRAGPRLPLLPRLRRGVPGRQRAADAGLHELPSGREAGQRRWRRSATAPPPAGRCAGCACTSCPATPTSPTAPTCRPASAASAATAASTRWKWSPRRSRSP